MMIALYGKKIGMTHVFDNLGALVPVSVLYIESNVVVSDRTEAKNGYNAKILAAFKNKPKRFNKSQMGFFKDIAPRKKVYEVRGYDDLEPGKEIGVEIFENVLFVDVVGISKGKGFQGVMRRHGHHGGPGGHGSKFHRTGGSTGHAATPSRVRKGTKMAGRMGNDRVTMQNLEIVSIDVEQGLLVVKGAVPGANGGAVLIKEAKKKRMVQNAS